MSLNGIDVSDETMTTMIEALEKSEDILEVDLSRCQLESEAITSFVKASKSGQITIRSLKLDQIPLGRMLLMHLALMLKDNHFIRKLSLQWCGVGEDIEAANAFFLALSQNDTLEHIDLSSNNIMSSLGKTLAQTGLKANYNLRIIDLSWNKIGESGGLAFAQMLKVNKSIQKIHLAGNDVSSSTLLSIDSQLHHNLQLHMKHAELVSKSLSFHNQLNMTREDLSEQLNHLKCDYTELESRGIQQQESMLFQMAQLEEQLKIKNNDMGALLEQQSLTAKALSVAEERIAFLELVDKRRDDHFKELQILCAEHEKAHQEESYKREKELENLLKEATREANLAKLEATKARDELEIANALNEQLKDNVVNLKKEKELMIVSHERVISQIKNTHKNVEEEWQHRRRQDKEDNVTILEELEQKHLEQLKEESEERSRLKQHISDLKTKMETIRIQHQESKSQMMQKLKLELGQLKEEKDTLESSLKVKLDELQNELDQSQITNKTLKQKGYETEVQLEKSRKVVKDQQKKIEDYERDKEHIRDLIKLDFEKEVDQNIKLGEDLNKLQLANQSLETELSTAKEAFDSERQVLTTNISQLESSLKEQIHQMEQQRFNLYFDN